MARIRSSRFNRLLTLLLLNGVIFGWLILTQQWEQKSKNGPSVVVSSDCVGKLPLKVAAPITDWKKYYAGNIWHVKIEPDIAKFCLNVNKHRKQQERLSSISLLLS